MIVAIVLFLVVVVPETAGQTLEMCSKNGLARS